MIQSYRVFSGIVVFCAIWLGLSGSVAGAQGRIQDLRIGLHASELPTEGFFRFACGSNGGTPLQPVEGWVGFGACAPDRMGLYEVYMELDDELEVLGRLFRERFDEPFPFQYLAGTRIAGYPVIFSVLFDAEGFIQGTRAVTDSRAETDERRAAYMFGHRMVARFNPGNWECEDLPLVDGEQPVGETRYIKTRCETVYRDESRMRVYYHFLRKPGQRPIDAQGNYLDGQWDSVARWEVFSLSLVAD